MAIAHTILACLVRSSHSGYELSKTFDQTISCFWKATQQQIYRELAKMEENKWVKAENVQQTGKPDKKVYSITDLGREELNQWLKQPSQITPIREDILVKMIVGYLLPQAELVQEIKRVRQIHQNNLDAYLEIEQQRYQNLAELSKQDQFLYLTLRRGIHYERDWINWCDEVSEILANQFR